METRSASSLLRSATAAAAALGLSAAGLWAFWLAGAGSLTAVRASGPDAAEDLLVLGAAGVGAVLLAWLGLGVTSPRSAPRREPSAGWPRRRPSTSPPPRSGG